MNKKLLGIALFVVFAFSAVAATAALAEEPQWLFNGSPVTLTLPVLSESSNLLLEDLKGGAFGEAIGILCSFLNEGTVGPKGVDTVTKIFDLAGNESPPNEILCEEETGTCGTPEVLPLNLPWSTQLDLKTDITDLITGNGFTRPGYVLTCTVLGQKVSDECTAEAAKPVEVLIENLPAEKDVDAIFLSIANGGVSPLAHCSRGGAETGVVEGEILIFHHEGELAVSDL